MAGRASIVGAAATHVGKVRDHNEDAHFMDPDLGVFIVCDGMGGHAAGEVASAMAIKTIRAAWTSDAVQKVADKWLESGTPEARKVLLDVLRTGVASAHDAILGEAERDPTKSGMGTTIVGAMIVGGELMFAHAGDSRAYLVRDGISMQLTEDHTLLARLLAAGIDVDTTGEGSRFRCMLTNALGIGQEIKVSMFVVPLADGDRFLLCSDGISEYVQENEVGDVLSKQPSPARAAQRLIDLALERGGGDNATALVVRVLEAGETPLPAEQRKRDDAAILHCALWGKRVTPQQRLRALRIAIPRDHSSGEMLPAHALGDRVAWIILEGALVQDGEALGPGALVYPESLLGDTPLPDRDAYAFTRSDVRALAIRSDDFRELCDDDSELGEALLESLAAAVAERRPRVVMRRSDPVIDARGNTDPHLPAVKATDPEPAAVARADAFEEVDPFRPTDPRVAAVRSPTGPDAYRPTDPRLDAVAFRPTDPRVEAVAPEHPRATTESEDFRLTVRDDDEPSSDDEPTSPEPRVARLRAAEPPPRPTPPPAGVESTPRTRTNPPPLAIEAVPRTRTNPPALAIEAVPRTRTNPPPIAAEPAARPRTSPTDPPMRPSPPPGTNPPMRPSPPPGTNPPMRPSPPPGTNPPLRPSPPPGTKPPPPAGTNPPIRATPPGTNPPIRATPPPPPSRTTPPAMAAEPPPRPTPPPPPHSKARASTPPPAGSASHTPVTLPPIGAATTRTPPRGIVVPVQRTKTPPSGSGPLQALTPPGGLAVQADPRPHRTTRPPTEPEIETVYEMEADEPSEPERARATPPPPDDDDDDQDIVVVRTVEDGDARITETVIETGSATLTVTVTELADEEHRSRAITAGDGVSVSGTISVEDPSGSAARRRKRISEGWDD